MTDRPFRHLCPEADERDAMSEDEFWERVAANLSGDQYPPQEPDWAAELDVTPLDSPACVLCGSTGACAYDAEGRALIHTTDDDDEDERA